MAGSVNKTIAVLGATGQQGKGVVAALKSNTDFKVRAITRSPDKYQGEADEAVAANLNDQASLEAAFDNVYGVFAVTNFWEQGTDETTQAKHAINAAKSANVQHFVWSTLPDVEHISDGKFDVPHFTNKAKIDHLVSEAGFPHHTFVVASFFYQNLITNMAPQASEDGSAGWVLPISLKSKSIHMADINELGATVAGAFVKPEKAGNGEYLPVVGDTLSFEDIVSALNNIGKPFHFQQVPRDVFADFFPGAGELAEMFGYFENHTYMGNKLGVKDFELEHEVAARIPTSFESWAAKHWI